MQKEKIHIVTLGCAKNVVDTEVLMRQIDASGFEVEHNAENSDAKHIIINTCGFIQDAKQESIDTILQYIQAKEEGLVENVFVMGCLSERYKQDLECEISEVDRYFGVNDLQQILQVLGSSIKTQLLEERVLSTPNHYAYLKISEGCDRSCSFCAIPLIRGKHKSRTIESLLKEANNLTEKGTKELILIAQDLTYYGIDLEKKQLLSQLLYKLNEIEGLEWIRLHYTYPASFPKDLLKAMKECEKVCNYIDMPIQHISDSVLSGMRRAISKDETYKLLNEFRSEIPNITLRTTLMTGFPGEGETEFEELVEFVKEMKFDRLGVFTYSEEEDTYAQKQFADDIPQEVKEERVDIIMQIQQDISLELNQQKIGNTYKTIIDRKEGDFYIGRTEADSPEVDNEILITTNKELTIGEFYNIKIESTDDFDLYGVV